MDRTIRVLAIAALVGLIAYAALMRAIQTALETTGPNLDPTPDLVVSFLARTSSFLAITTVGPCWWSASNDGSPGGWRH